MIYFDLANARFKYRVAGVCLHDDHVLLQGATGADYWALPGGRIEIMEDTRTALHREMREELGCEVSVGRLLWVVENFFSLDAKDYHELAFLYEIQPSDRTLLDRSWTSATTDGGICINFRWFPLSCIGETNLKPAFLKPVLRDPPQTPHHIIVNELHHKLTS
jgi:ADP-ribose pyrophosphatase YjhB (NUDIX family)